MSFVIEVRLQSIFIFVTITHIAEKPAGLTTPYYDFS